MNQQETFTKAYKAVIRQGEPGLSEDGFCTYRDQHGHRCAVGLMLSDTVLDGLKRTGMDGEGISGMMSILDDAGWTPQYDDNEAARNAVRLARGELLIDDLDERDTLKFWDDLQGCHDTAAREHTGSQGAELYTGDEFVKRFRENARMMARLRGLEVPNV